MKQHTVLVKKSNKPKWGVVSILILKIYPLAKPNLILPSQNASSYKTVCSTNITGSNVNDIHSAGKRIITAQKVRLALQAFREDCSFILHSPAVLKRSIDMS